MNGIGGGATVRPRAPGTETVSPAAKHALVSGGIGSALEYTDFALYGALAATVFPQLFFSSLDPTAGLLASLAGFGVAFVARPIGGVVFGRLGDRYGRRNALFTTVALMGVVTFAIGVLPTYQSIGIWAPLLLTGARFLQGFAFGGETTGSQLMVLEHAPRDRRAFYGAVMNIGAPLGQVFSSVSLVLLTLSLSDEQFLAWGWRVPFLLSLIMVGIGLYIRFRVEETPLFVDQVEETPEPVPSLWRLVRTRRATILRLVLAEAPIMATSYIVAVFGLSYMKSRGVSTDTTFAMLLVANVVACLVMLLGGRLADRIGRRKVMLTGVLVCLLVSCVFFLVVNTGILPLAFLVFTLAVSGQQFGYAALAALFAESFPTNERYTGSALSFTIAGLVFGAPTPFVAAWITSSSVGTVGVTVLWAFVAVLGAVSLATLGEPPSLEGEAQSFGFRRRSTPAVGAVPRHVEVAD